MAQGTQVEEDIDLILVQGPDFYESSGPLLEALNRLSASPSVYVDAIEERLSLPDNNNLTNYPDSVELHQTEELLGILSVMGWRNLATPEIQTVVNQLYFEVVEDLDLMNESLTNNPPANLAELKHAINSAELILITLLDVIRDFGDSTVLEDALERYENASYRIKPFLEGFSKVISGNFPPPSFTIDLNASWQLISLSLQPLNPSYSSIFSNVLLMQSPFSWEAQSYSSENNLQVGRAYWIQSETVGLQSIAGLTQSLITVSLVQGWNMVGGPTCDLSASSVSDPSGIIINGTLYGYDNGYQQDSIFVQGKGYWVQANSAGQVTLDCNAASKAASSPLPISPTSLGRLVVNDAIGGNQSLYFGSTLPDDHSVSYNMPPRPPVGVFDARFANDSRLIEDSAAEVHVQSSNYPITVELERAPEGVNRFVLEELALGQVVATHLLDTPVEITNTDVTAFRIRPE